MIESILLIDDSEPDNFLHQYLLKKSKIVKDIHGVNKVEEAIEFLDELVAKGLPMPTIICLDINMPRIDGWEFLDFLQNNSDKYDISSTHIYILSTSINPDDQQKVLDNHLLKGFLSKPLNLDVIMDFANNL